MIALLAVCISRTAPAQDIYVSRNAQISFFSSAPIEDIQAETDKAVSAINTKTGSVYFKVPIKSFQFEKDLMQSHFNSDYLESEKFPYAEFKGKITEPLDAGIDSTFAVNVTGQLTIHGVTKDYSGPGTIKTTGGKISATAAFKVRLADHDITIPRLLMRNIAEVVQVKVNAVYAADTAVQLSANHE